MKRHPLYFGVMILLPTLLFSLLNPLVFLLPVESGERVSLSMTILLSYAIFLTLVSNSIPKTSNPMCTLLIVMIVIISLSKSIITPKYNGWRFIVKSTLKVE
jgi:nicotinic acetylcholine receptor alpha-7